MCLSQTTGILWEWSTISLSLLPLMIQIILLPERAWSFSTLLTLFVTSFWKCWTLYLGIRSFYLLIPQIQDPIQDSPPLGGLPQCSRSALITRSSVFLLCLVWPSITAFSTLSWNYALWLSLEFNFLSRSLSYSYLVFNVWYSAQGLVSTVQRWLYKLSVFFSGIIGNASSVSFVPPLPPLLPSPPVLPGLPSWKLSEMDNAWVQT